MTTLERGELLNEGKTKKVYGAHGMPGKAIVEYKNAITAFDDPNFTREFSTKAKHSNTITCRVFEMLARASVPVAYVEQVSDTEFLAESCTMIPLEIVGRRYAVGSYLKRHPEHARAESEPPARFDTPVVEFFLKTTKGGLKSVDGTVIVEGLDPKKGEEDPFIPNPHESEWRLVHPKMLIGDSAADLGRVVASERVLRGARIEEIEAMVVQTLEILEAFFAQHNFKLIDFKIECGVTPNGRVVIADVIDNDSWRLRDSSWRDVSKQSFRDGEDLATIEDKYALVAALLESSRVTP